MNERGASMAGVATIPPLRKVAHNSATDSENRIHSDEEARRLGLRGGLVPGVTLYAYLTERLIGALGLDWLRRGTASVRFIRPVYEGEEVTCTAVPGDGSSAPLEIAVLGPDGALCVTGNAGIAAPDQAGDRPESAWSPDPIAPEARPALRRETAPIGRPLAARTVVFDPEAAAAYADEAGDPSPWYRGGSPFGLPLVPPALIASQPARLLRENFSFGPSVHAASEIRHLGLPLAGGAYRIEGTPLETFEKRGNDYLVTDVRVFDHTGAAVMRIRHTTIFRFTPRA
jgi:acyl dehydratase